MRGLATLLVSLLLAGTVAASDGYFSILYGFKLGQPLANALEVFGEPQRVHTFPDGWKAHIFQRQGHNLVLEVNDTRPDLIISIQIQGLENPDGLGLGGIDLGMPIDEALRRLGPPDRQENAMDAVTQQPVEGTAINFYGDGMTMEQRDGAVSSIKIIYGGPAEAEDEPDIAAFFARIHARDYYGLAEMISSNMTIGSEAVVGRSLLGAIVRDTALRQLLYGSGGLSTMGAANDGGGNVRTLESGQVGFVIQLVDRSVSELVFTRSFEGWVLVQANPPAEEPVADGDQLP